MITKLIGKFGMMLAVLAAVSLVISPIAPALAAAPEAAARMSNSAVRAKLVQHAKRGEAAILTKRQIDKLARTNPDLHKRLMAAYGTGTVPKVTPAERKMLAGMSEQNLGKFKAGVLPVAVAASAAIPWFIWGFFFLVAFLIFYYWVTGKTLHPFGRS